MLHQLTAPHRSFLKFFFVALFIVATAAIARAQGNYEIQVYGAETVAPRSTMVELHSNFTADGQPAIGGVAATNHAEHETIEITQGINDWSEVGFYIFTSEQSRPGRPVGGRPHPSPRPRA